MNVLSAIGLALALSACASDSSPSGAQGGSAGNVADPTSSGGTTGGVLSSTGGNFANGGTSGGQGAAPFGGSSSGGDFGAAGVVTTSTGGTTDGSAGTAGRTSGGAGVTSGGVNSGGKASTGGLAAGGGGESSVSGGAQSAGGSAGASTGGNAGSPASGGSAACAGLICEDFESGKIDSTKWDLIAKSGTLTVQSQRVAHGQYAAALHGPSGAADDWSLLVAKNVPAALKGATTFGRLYFYWAPEATASIHIQMAFAGHTGSGSANGPAPFPKLRYMEVASYGGRVQLGFDLLDLSPLVEEVSYSDGRLPTNKWACLEWKFEDAPDRVTAWVDGTQISSFDNTNVDYASPGPAPKSGAALWDGKSSDLIGGFDTFGVGFHDWHPQKAFDVFYDDVVLDSKRIGCL